jgi:hypothetical protein
MICDPSVAKERWKELLSDFTENGTSREDPLAVPLWPAGVRDSWTQGEPG